MHGTCLGSFYTDDSLRCDWPRHRTLDVRQRIEQLYLQVIPGANVRNAEFLNQGNVHQGHQTSAGHSGIVVPIQTTYKISAVCLARG